MLQPPNEPFKPRHEILLVLHECPKLHQVVPRHAFVLQDGVFVGGKGPDALFELELFELGREEFVYVWVVGAVFRVREGEALEGVPVDEGADGGDDRGGAVAGGEGEGVNCFVVGVEGGSEVDLLRWVVVRGAYGVRFWIFHVEDEAFQASAEKDEGGHDVVVDVRGAV